ncbi:MAG: hypothetical protein O7F76_01165 [Planctomycetota bacterium]|nr:hypothetical protein [Planctomycetota bacterium]
MLIMLLAYPAIIPDSDNLSAVPLIPGYHEGQKRFDQPYAKSHWSPKYAPWPLELVPNSESPVTAQAYWDEVRQRLRRRFEPTQFDYGPDLRLNHYHYPRVKAFIERELRRMDSIESAAPAKREDRPADVESAKPVADASAHRIFSPISPLPIVTLSVQTLTR